MKEGVKIWLLLLAVVFSGHLHAGQRWFQIELIVFTQNFPTTEQFDQVSSQIRWPRGLNGLSGSVYSLAALRNSPFAFAQLGTNDRLLNDTYARLEQSPNYQPLVHLSWVQPVAGNQLSDAVQIQADDLNGFVRIERGNYLYLWVDLEYKPGQIIYRLNEKRRIKLNETHYLDHPKLGVIARVAPL